MRIIYSLPSLTLVPFTCFFLFFLKKSHVLIPSTYFLFSPISHSLTSSSPPTFLIVPLSIIVMSSSSGPVKLYIVYYSTWLHVHELALAIQRGAQKVPGLEIKLFQMAETLPDAGKWRILPLESDG